MYTEVVVRWYTYRASENFVEVPQADAGHHSGRTEDKDAVGVVCEQIESFRPGSETTGAFHGV